MIGKERSGRSTGLSGLGRVEPAAQLVEMTEIQDPMINDESIARPTPSHRIFLHSELISEMFEFFSYMHQMQHRC
jgi:hypothetical protein